MREADPAVTDRVDAARLRFAAESALSTNASDSPFSIEVGSEHEPDAELARDVSELRLVKDAYEIAQMRLAVDATAARLRRRHRRPARASSRTRAASASSRACSTAAPALEGNAVGYDTIAASGPHACILHWTRNDGPVAPGDLMLLDAGVEVDSLYTADITRTLPITGTFSRRCSAGSTRPCCEAADAAFAIVKPGIDFREVHAAAMEVIAARTAEWGLLPVTRRGGARAREPVLPPLHGARHEPPPRPRRARLRAGAPRHVHGRRARGGHGLHDRAGPVLPARRPDRARAEYRGIGVRIEDDILVTADGAENLSVGIPRTASAVEAWVQAGGWS